MSFVVYHFKPWLKLHERSLPIIGAIILALTYATKEVWQANLESKTRHIESFLTETRLLTHIDALQPDLREQLSRGTDQNKKLATANAELFLKGGPGVDPPSFSVVVELECESDSSCRAAEWYRHRTTVYARIRMLDQFAALVGDPLSREDEEFARRLSLEDVARKKLIKKNRSDGNLVKPTEPDVERYGAALQGLESAVDGRDLSLGIDGAQAIKNLELRLRAVSILSAVFYFIGWSLSLLGLIYGPVGAPPKAD